MKYWRLLAAGAAILLAIIALNQFASHEAIETRRLAEHKGRWTAHNVRNYRFTIASRGAWGIGPMVSITVNNGNVTTAIRAHGTHQAPVGDCAVPYMMKRAKPCNTVPDLFARVAEMIGERRSRTAVRYNPGLGYPELVAYDLQNAADEEFTVRISDFETIN